MSDHDYILADPEYQGAADYWHELAAGVDEVLAAYLLIVDDLCETCIAGQFADKMKDYADLLSRSTVGVLNDLSTGMQTRLRSNIDEVDAADDYIYTYSPSYSYHPAAPASGK